MEKKTLWSVLIGGLVVGSAVAAMIVHQQFAAISTSWQPVANLPYHPDAERVAQDVARAYEKRSLQQAEYDNVLDDLERITSLQRTLSDTCNQSTLHLIQNNLVTTCAGKASELAEAVQQHTDHYAKLGEISQEMITDVKVDHAVRLIVLTRSPLYPDYLESLQAFTDAYVNYTTLISNNILQESVNSMTPQRRQKLLAHLQKVSQAQTQLDRAGQTLAANQELIMTLNR